MDKSLKILVVEDNKAFAASLKEELSSYGQVFAYQNSRHAMVELKRERFDLALIDINLEEQKAGFEVLKLAKELSHVHTVILSSHDEDEIIDQAYELGCDDYLSKDVSNDQLHSFIETFLNKNSQVSFEGFFSEEFVTASEELKADIERILKFDTKARSVFITGPSGVGKSILAKKIHDNAFSEDKPFVHINCSQFSKELLASEIFGHVKGAFTGAISDKKGMLEKADGGTIFLDEIGTMPYELQQKLLLVVETGALYRVGEERPRNIKVKKISATCEPIEKYISSGKFRSDLYFRLNEITLNIPGLKHRKNDIPLQVKSFLREKRRIVFTQKAKDLLQAYSWPGNSRELKNLISALSSSDKGRISDDDLKKLLDINKESLEDVSGGFISPEHINYIQSNGLKSFLSRMKEEAGEAFLKKNNNSKRAAMREMKFSSSSFPWKETSNSIGRHP